MNRIARDLNVDPDELLAATLRAVAAAPFVLAGLIAFCLLLAALA